MMMRKFMIDSLRFWATEYKIDGFRFDLMALHDIETVNIIRDELNKIDPQILMYGEGWTEESHRSLLTGLHINGTHISLEELDFSTITSEIPLRAVLSIHMTRALSAETEMRLLP